MVPPWCHPSLALIELSLLHGDELFVAPTYVVFPDQIRNVQIDGPFAQLVFSPASSSIPAGSTLVITRNGTEIARTSFPSEYSIGLKQVRSSNDLVEWRVEDKVGNLSYHSTRETNLRGFWRPRSARPTTLSPRRTKKKACSLLTAKRSRRAATYIIHLPALRKSRTRC